MYDAIVVGARVAGSPTAMLLARGGHKVLLLDRDTFPSDIMTTHFITHTGVESLQRWGLLDAVRNSNCPPITRISQDFGGLALSGEPPLPDGIDGAYCPRRGVLDTILVRAAAAAGAELREGFSVQEIVTDGDRVSGVRGRGKGGASVNETARIVIGADGVNSAVARAVQAAQYNEYNARPATTCGYYSYWSGIPDEGAAIWWRDERIVFRFPTNDGLTCLATEAPKAGFTAFRADIEANFQRGLEAVSRRPAAARSAGPAPRICPTSTASLLAPAGRSPATRATTRIPSPARASPTPSATPSCWPRR